MFWFHVSRGENSLLVIKRHMFLVYVVLHRFASFCQLSPFVQQQKYMSWLALRWWNVNWQAGKRPPTATNPPQHSTESIWLVWHCYLLSPKNCKSVNLPWPGIVILNSFRNHDHSCPSQWSWLRSVWKWQRREQSQLSSSEMVLSNSLTYQGKVESWHEG